MIAHTKQAHSPSKDVSPILLVLIIFCVINALSLIFLNADQVLRLLKLEPRMEAFFHHQTDELIIQRMSDEFKTKEYVAHVETISQDQALEIYRQANLDNPLLLEMVTADILPASLNVTTPKVMDLLRVKNDFDNQQFVDQVELNSFFLLLLLADVVRWIGILVAVGLGVTVVLKTKTRA